MKSFSYFGSSLRQFPALHFQQLCLNYGLIIIYYLPVCARMCVYTVQVRE